MYKRAKKTQGKKERSLVIGGSRPNRKSFGGMQKGGG